MYENLRTPSILECRRKHVDRLEALYAGLPSAHAYVLNGIYGSSRTNMYEEPEKWVLECLADMDLKASLSIDERIFRPLCVEYSPYGVHFIDKILGAEVYFESGQWYSRYLDTPVGSLRKPDLDACDVWNMSKRAAAAFLEADVSVPYLGMPTIASVLNIAINLYGQEILVSMHVSPKEAEHDLEIINELLIDLHKWYIANIPADQLQAVVSGHRTQPPGYGQLCGCSTQLLSPSMYRDFIAKYDDALLSTYPNGGMIHLCGSHTQHIPVWRQMESLRAVQLNDRAAEDLNAYFDGLREDQIIYLNPFEKMTVQHAMAITGGRRLVIVGEIPPPPTVY